MSVFYMVPTQLPYMLVDVYAMSGSTVGMLMATVTFVSAITSLFYAKLRRRWKISHIYGGLFLVQGAGFFGLGVAGSYAQFSLALTAVGIGVGLVIVNTNSWLLESAQEHERLKATGWLSSSIFLGQFISPLLMQPPVGLVGIAGTFSLVGTMLVAIGFVILLRLVWRVE
jgi:MFS family permease